MSKCQMEHCNRPVKHPRLGICGACYQALYYWKHKSVAEIIRRKNALKLFGARMNVVEPKISVLPQRRRK